MKKDCEYCRNSSEYPGAIFGYSIRTHKLKETHGYTVSKNSDIIDYLELFILKGQNDKKAGLMLDNIYGARYVEINYCPFCGRKIGE